MLCPNIRGEQIVLNIIQTIQQNRKYLSQIDGQIRDGDHGVNMSKGFTIAGDLLSQKHVDMSTAFSVLANILMTKIGGSIGPLYGTIFDEMAKASKDAVTIDLQTVEKNWGKPTQGIKVFLQIHKSKSLILKWEA